MTHIEWIAFNRPAMPCTVHHTTFGGVCLNCGYDPAKAKWPETYMHVEECRSGQVWIVPLRGNASLSISKQVKKWAKQEFGGELRLDPPIMPRLQGDYYAAIYTDGREPTCGICWDSGGFYLKGSD